MRHGGCSFSRLYLAIPFYQLCNSKHQQLKVTRLNHIIVGPSFVSAQQVVVAIQSRKHDYGHGLCLLVGTQLAHNLVSVNIRQHNVAQNNAWLVRLYSAKCRLSVGIASSTEVAAYASANLVHHVRIVFNYRNCVVVIRLRHQVFNCFWRIVLNHRCVYGCLASIVFGCVGIFCCGYGYCESRTSLGRYTLVSKTAFVKHGRLVSCIQSDSHSALRYVSVHKWLV